MSEYIKFWLAKAALEIGIALAIIVVWGIGVVIYIHWPRPKAKPPKRPPIQ